MALRESHGGDGGDRQSVGHSRRHRRCLSYLGALCRRAYRLLYLKCGLPRARPALELSCEAGQVIWNSREHQVKVYTAADGKWQHYSETAGRGDSNDGMYFDELAHFIQAVRGEVTYMRDFAGVKRMLEVLCAIEQSAAEGRRISLA